MAQRNEKVFDRIRQELGKNPNLGSKELYEVAQGVDKDISQDSLQQFHARYVLPIKREKSGASKPAEGGRKARGGRKAKTAGTSSKGQPAARRRTKGVGEAVAAVVAPAAAKLSTAARSRASRQRSQGTVAGANRDQVRALLLQFAQELTDADSRSSLVKVLGKVDSYVDRIASA